MKQKIILIASLMLLSSVVFVSAVSFTTTTFTNDYANDYGITKTGYKISYDIPRSGWYLLPNQEAVISVAEETGDYVAFYKSVDYKWAFSPFSKKYVACERKPNYNPLYCDFKKIYDESGSYLSSLSKEDFARNYRAFTALSADWHYYSKPVKVVYEYQPFMLYDFKPGDDNVGLMSGKLKSGWNLITYPAYLGFENVELGDCNIEKAYIWNDENQEWSNIINNLIDEDSSGGGVAIKVMNDCIFLKKKSSSTPPSVPN